MSHKTKYAKCSYLIITLSEQVPPTPDHNEHLSNSCCKVATCNKVMLSRLTLENHATYFCLKNQDKKVSNRTVHTTCTLMVNLLKIKLRQSLTGLCTPPVHLLKIQTRESFARLFTPSVLQCLICLKSKQDSLFQDCLVFIFFLV